jgi:hypothetical protein
MLKKYIFREKVQWYFREINFKNIYFKKYWEWRGCRHLFLDVSWGIYNFWILLFCWSGGAAESFYPYKLIFFIVRRITLILSG